MFTKTEIKSYLKYVVGSENDGAYTDCQNLQHSMIEAKMLIDRHNLITTDFVLHPSKKEQVMQAFKANAKTLTSLATTQTIWGATIHFCEHLPEDKGIALCRDPKTNQLFTHDARSIAVFPCNY